MEQKFDVHYDIDNPDRIYTFPVLQHVESDELIYYLILHYIQISLHCTNVS